MMRLQLLPFSCVLLCATLLRSVGASCYYPDGTFPTDYVYEACSGDEFTSCCIPSEGDQCLSNGLCYDPTSSYQPLFRGACTDKTFKSDKCFQHCTGGDVAGTYDRLVSCGQNRYCCSSEGSTCCNDDSKVFDVNSASIIKTLGTSSIGLPIATDTPTSTGTGNFGTGQTTSGRPTNAGSQSKATGSATGSQASNKAAAATSTSETSDVAAADSHPSHKITLIAGGTGGVLLLLGGIGLAWYLLRRRYRKKLAAGSNNAFPMSSEFQKLPDKTPRPVEVPAPLHSPAPPYQPPAYGHYGAQHGAVEIDNSYIAPQRNQYGQPVYEAPAQAYGL